MARDASGRVWVSVSPPDPGAASLAWREPGASSFTTLPAHVGGTPRELAWGFARSGGRAGEIAAGPAPGGLRGEQLNPALKGPASC